MGREVKRVAMDFVWPLGKVWSGFLNNRPGPDTCMACNGDGGSPVAQRLENKWYGYEPFDPTDTGSVPLTIDHPPVREFATRNAVRMYFTQRQGFDADITAFWAMVKKPGMQVFLEEHYWLQDDIDREAQRLVTMWNSQWCHHLDADDVKALLDAGRLMDFTARPHNAEQEEILKKQAEAGGSDYWLREGNGYVPTPQEVNDWSITGGMGGHDSINQWVCVKAKCKRLGYRDSCADCRGHGHKWRSQEARKFYNAWKPKEPPKGDGWQMWSTTSEGSPMSPVCESPEALARWLADTGASAMGRDTATYDQWLAMIQAGWAMDMVQKDGKLTSGVEAVSA